MTLYEAWANQYKFVIDRSEVKRIRLGHRCVIVGDQSRSPDEQCRPVMGKWVQNTRSMLEDDPNYKLPWHS